MKLKWTIGLVAGISWLVFPLAARANTYYASPSGSDTNSGTLASPWKTLTNSLTKISAGDTLNLRSGTYYEGSITTSIKGTASAPIVIQSYPGERAVIDGGVADYKTVPNTGWELVDASIGLYRTTKTYTGTVGAWLVNDDTQLIQYDDPLNMESTYYGPLDDTQYLYFGPGVQLRSDGKLYIRLQSNPKDLDAQDPDGGGGDGFGNDLAPVPANTDPNQNSISVFTTQTLITLQGAAFLQFKDITFQYAKKIMDWQTGTNNITLENCTINYGTTGILQTGADTALIKNCEFNNGVPMTMFWTDVKNRKPDEALAGGEPYPEFQSGALSAVPNLTFEGNTVRRTFDGISLVPGVGNVTIRNSYFLITKDDAINLSLDNYNVEIDHNLFWYIHSGISLFKHTGTPGEVYIHHNVLDGSLLTRTGRPGNYRANSYPPWAGGNPFSGHDGTSAAHWKIYNNTFISQKGKQAGAAMSPGAVTGNSAKYLYNNIFYALDNRVLLSEDQEADGSHYDGNIFWQGTTGTMFSNFANGGSYSSLAALRASGTSWEASALQIHPGFDNALLLNPTFDPLTIWQRYVPTNPQIFTIGVPYTALTWPGTAGVSYRGAISPTPTPSPTPLAGDLNGDGYVNLTDLLQAILGLNIFNYNSVVSNFGKQ